MENEIKRRRKKRKSIKPKVDFSTTVAVPATVVTVVGDYVTAKYIYIYTFFYINKNKKL